MNRVQELMACFLANQTAAGVTVAVNLVYPHYHHTQILNSVEYCSGLVMEHFLANQTTAGCRRDRYI